ncbi:PulJ/GspJ family protein [Cohnella sp. 56]|uniref:PulJ/GspJ family protein n=1 Tax=Cohnella sp. 56 TaxID=3113722 RepID=UPI0030E8EEAD
MKRFAERLHRGERGFTLIEMIASLTVFSMVSLAIYGVIQFGFNTYHKVTIENSLRDEGDLIMSTVIAQLYEVGPERVEQLPNGIRLVRDNQERRIEINDGQLHIIRENGTDQLVDTRSAIGTIGSSREIQVSCQAGLNECPSGLIAVSIKLSQSYASKVQALELTSRFGF